MTSDVDFCTLVERIRNRLKEEAKDFEELVKLEKENPKLAELLSSIDDIISDWGVCELRKKGE